MGSTSVIRFCEAFFYEKTSVHYLQMQTEWQNTEQSITEVSHFQTTNSEEKSSNTTFLPQ